MKKSFYLIGVLAAILCSCTNLDEEIYSSIPKDRFFTSEEQFPLQFRDYITFLEQQLETPITIISIGPDREQTILLNPLTK